MPDLCSEVSQLSTELEKVGVDLFTVDGKIIFYLMNNGSSRIKEIMLATGSSYRGFYLALERLKNKKLIDSEVDPVDRRARVIRLATPTPAPSVHRGN
ncbi:hypothetical protein [Qipengyuania sp. RANM35]|uniref:hypothetical protein n=1 Tax=Qipengyuania sp. RANM35 TaxID=3068635 RepID=UPI0034DB2096